MISLICPTRGRPDQFARMMRSVRSTSSTPVNIITASNGDPGCDLYAVNFFPLDTPTVFMWNTMAQKTNDDLIMLASDDIVFSTPGWDEAILNHYKSLHNKAHVYALQDSRDKDGTPHPVVTREYMEAMGYFLPPLFLHWFVDSWTVSIAKANGCFTHMREFELIHDKPSDSGKSDETHKHIRNMGWHARDAAVNISCRHFLELEKTRLGALMDKKYRSDYMGEVC